MGGLFLTGNTASIDTGFMNTKLHVFCAGKFFIFTILAQIYNTVVCARLSQQTSAISKWNMYLKYFILGMFVLQVIDSLSKGYGLLGWLEGGSGSNSDKGIFLEWTMTATVITNFLSVGLDAIKF